MKDFIYNRKVDQYLLAQNFDKVRTKGLYECVYSRNNIINFSDFLRLNYVKDYDTYVTVYGGTMNIKFVSRHTHKLTSFIIVKTTDASDGEFHLGCLEYYLKQQKEENARI